MNSKEIHSISNTHFIEGNIYHITMKFYMIIDTHKREMYSTP